MWEKDLGLTTQNDQWKQILTQVHSSSTCARHNLLQCKILCRVHFINAKLVKILPDCSDSCNRCKQSLADYYHMFWTTHDYQNSGLIFFFKKVNGALGIAVAATPLTGIFGVTTNPKTPKSIVMVSLLLLSWLEDLFHLNGHRPLQPLTIGGYKTYCTT